MSTIQSRKPGKKAKKIVTLTRKFPARKAKVDWWEERKQKEKVKTRNFAFFACPIFAS